MPLGKLWLNRRGAARARGVIKSELGQSRRFGSPSMTSGFPPKADPHGRSACLKSATTGHAGTTTADPRACSTSFCRPGDHWRVSSPGQRRRKLAPASGRRWRHGLPNLSSVPRDSAASQYERKERDDQTYIPRHFVGHTQNSQPLGPKSQDTHLSKLPR
jgi:hypothetical protein